jgi:hypothetical protein
VLTSLEIWEKEQEWLLDRDGLTSIGLAPIRFWDTLGRASLVALACRVAADFRSEGKLAALVAEIVRLSFPIVASVTALPETRSGAMCDNKC